MIGRGKKTKLWDSHRAELKKEFYAMGITSCEIRFAGCWNDNGLGFAHIDKRNNLTPDELRYGVVLACNHCHDIVERWPHEKMRAYLTRIIETRQDSQQSYQVIGKGVKIEYD